MRLLNWQKVNFQMQLFRQREIEKYKDFMIMSIIRKDKRWSICLAFLNITKESSQDLKILNQGFFPFFILLEL